MVPDFEAILGAYEVGRLVRATPAGRGTTSQAWLVHTEGGAWILRRLADQAQADRECAIAAQVLRTADVVPTILPTGTGAAAAWIGGAPYGLQRFVGDRLPPRSEDALRKLGERIGLLDRALQGFGHPSPAIDRFDPGQAWASIEPRWPTVAAGLPERWRHASVFARCADLQADVEHGCDGQWIHADLGVWNVVWDATLPFVVDFGEARCSNPLFDAAALTTSWGAYPAPPVAVATFANAYRSAGAAWDPEGFEACVRLWLLRGALAALAAGEAGAAIRHLKVFEAFECAFKRL